jgi:phenylacetate-CoA ligase
MRTSVMPYPRVIRLMRDLPVTLTWSNPTDCLLWAATAGRAGLDPGTDFPALRALITGGEPLSGARRDRLSELWGGIPVIDEYGCTELGSLAGTCPAGRQHLWADRVKPEVYHPESGQITDDGTGELVLTPLFLEAMPLIRYNMKDRVSLSYGECPCGWHLPTIRLLGRTAQSFTVGEVRVSQPDIEDVVFQLPARYGVLFWRARVLSSHLVVQIEVGDLGVAEAAADSLRDALWLRLGLESKVEPLAPGTLVPDEVVVSPRQSLKPRSLFGPDENWDQAIIFPGQ